MEPAEVPFVWTLYDSLHSLSGFISSHDRLKEELKAAQLRAGTASHNVLTAKQDVPTR
jgi:hypothetical protein